MPETPRDLPQAMEGEREEEQSKPSAKLLLHLKHAFNAVENQFQEFDSSQEQLRASEQRNHALHEALNEAKALRKEAESKSAQLERFVVDQKKHIERTQQCLEHERSLNKSLTSQLNQMETILTDVETQQQAFETERKKLRLTISTMNEQISNLRAEAKASSVASKKALDKAAGEQRQLREAQSKHLSLISSLKSTLASAQKAVAENMQQHEAALAASAASASRTIDELKAEVKQQTMLQKKHLAMNSDSVKQITQMTKRIEELELNLSTSAELVKQLTEKLSSSREEHDTKLEGLSTELGDAVSRAAQLSKQVQVLRKAVKVKEAEVEAARVTAREKSEADAKRVEAAHKDAVDDLRQELHNARKSTEFQKKLLCEKTIEADALLAAKQKLKASFDEIFTKLKMEEKALKTAKVAFNRTVQSSDKRSKEAEKQRSALQKELAKAVKARENSDNRLKQLEKESLQMSGKLSEMRGKVQSCDQERRRCEEILTSQSQELKRLLAAEQKKREEAEREKADSDQAHCLELQKVHHEFERRNSEMSHQYNQLQAELDAYAERRRSYETMVKKLEERVNVVQAEKAELKASSTVRIADVEKAFNQLQLDKDSLQEENGNLHTELKQLGDALTQVRKDSIVAHGEKKDALLRLQTAESAFLVLRREMQAEEDAVSSKTLAWSSKCKRLEEQVSSLRQERSKAISDTNLVQTRLTAALQQIGELRQEKEKGRVERTEAVKALEATVESLSEARDAKAMEVIRAHQTFESEKRKIQAHAKQEKEEMHKAMEGLKWRVETLGNELEDAKSAQAVSEDRVKRLEEDNRASKQNEAHLIKKYQELASRSVQQVKAQPLATSRQDQVFCSIKDFIRKKYPSDVQQQDRAGALGPEDDDRNERLREDEYLRDLLQNKSTNQLSSDGEDTDRSERRTPRVRRKRLSKVKMKQRRPRSALTRRT